MSNECAQFPQKFRKLPIYGLPTDMRLSAGGPLTMISVKMMWGIHSGSKYSAIGSNWNDREGSHRFRNDKWQMSAIWFNQFSIAMFGCKDWRKTMALNICTHSNYLLMSRNCLWNCIIAMGDCDWFSWNCLNENPSIPFHSTSPCLRLAPHRISQIAPKYIYLFILLYTFFELFQRS